MAEFRFKAIYLAPELVISKVKEALKYKLVQEKRERLVYEAAPKKYIFIYSFGAVVFYDIDEKIQNDILKAIKSLKLGEIKNEISDIKEFDAQEKEIVKKHHIRENPSAIKEEREVHSKNIKNRLLLGMFKFL